MSQIINKDIRIGYWRAKQKIISRILQPPLDAPEVLNADVKRTNQGGKDYSDI